MEMAKDRGLIRFQGQAGTFSELVNAVPYTLTEYVTDNMVGMTPTTIPVRRSLSLGTDRQVSSVFRLCSRKSKS